LIVVYGIRERLAPIRQRLSDAIHDCMKQVLGMPEDKRAHRFMGLAREDFFYPGGRSEAYTVIEINMIQGRAEETKKALIRKLFAVLEADVGLAPVDVEITIHEQPPHCWGFRGMTGDEAKLNYRIDV
jgi:phenylpyruvate tautomerase PptA (4-oxalocrotonate tautomerase family)